MLCDNRGMDVRHVGNPPMLGHPSRAFEESKSVFDCKAASSNSTKYTIVSLTIISRISTNRKLWFLHRTYLSLPDERESPRQHQDSIEKWHSVCCTILIMQSSLVFTHTSMQWTSDPQLWKQNNSTWLTRETQCLTEPARGRHDAEKGIRRLWKNPKRNEKTTEGPAMKTARRQA